MCRIFQRGAMKNEKQGKVMAWGKQELTGAPLGNHFKSNNQNIKQGA